MNQVGPRQMGEQRHRHQPQSQFLSCESVRASLFCRAGRARPAEPPGVHPDGWWQRPQPCGAIFDRRGAI